MNHRLRHDQANLTWDCSGMMTCQHALETWTDPCTVSTRSMPNFGTHAYLFLQQSSDREEALPNYVPWTGKSWKQSEKAEYEHHFGVFVGGKMAVSRCIVFEWSHLPFFFKSTISGASLVQPHRLRLGCYQMLVLESTLRVKVNWLRKRKLREDAVGELPMRLS